MNKVSLYNKEMYGEVTTTNVLIDQLFDMLDDGVFVNDKLNGPGKVTYPDGQIEEGLFKEDLLHGQGKRTFPNG